MKQYELTEVLDGNYSNWSLCFEMWPCIQALNIKPYKDGNQWCFLYGENIQDGICGFGKTIRDAALDFYCNICNEEIVANKLKSLRLQPIQLKEQKPVDYEAELKKCKDNLLYFYDKYVSIKQKPAEWGEEDEHNLNSVINLVHTTTDGAWGSCIGDRIENWLKNLPERFNLQPKPEWGEEDEKMLQSIIKDFRAGKISTIGQERWLKSLRPQYHGDVTMTEAYKMGKEAGEASHWKPSEEQMKALEETLETYKGFEEYDAMKSLYEQLNKL